MKSANYIKELVDAAYPGLYDRIKQYIEKSEADFEGEKRDSHLWEHVVLVASLACTLCTQEQLDPLIPVISALLHDSGKFKNKSNQLAKEPEELESIRIGEQILGELEVSREKIAAVSNAIRSLYREQGKKNRITDLIHDADFLAKSGSLGIGVYFAKSALRGQNLLNWIKGSASRELTYASYLPVNMRTAAGKNFAEKDKKFTLEFFTRLFLELREKGIKDLIIRHFRISPPGFSKKITLSLVSPRICPKCSLEPKPEFSYETGIKCEKVNVRIFCPNCQDDYRTSFCLPEVGY